MPAMPPITGSYINNLSVDQDVNQFEKDVAATGTSGQQLQDDATKLQNDGVTTRDPEIAQVINNAMISLSDGDYCQQGTLDALSNAEHEDLGFGGT